MDTLFVVIEAVFVLGAVVTMTMIVREVFPSLAPEDQPSLSGPWLGPSFRVLRERDRAISNAWKEHARSFPRSRKRLLFALCFIAGALSVMLYPVWLAFGPR